MNTSPPSKLSKWVKKIQTEQPSLYFFLDVTVNILVIVALVYAVRTFLISPFQVYGPSMCNTLNFIDEECQDGFGEYLIVNKASYYPFFGKRLDPPERGDIIVFHPPQNKTDFYIKRIIGLPGERIEIKNGKVFIYNKEHQGGVELQEDYLSEENHGKTFPVPSHIVADYEVPEDMYFVLGDNRRHSTDSRHCFLGTGCGGEKEYFLPIKNIEGKASIVLWPLNKIRLLQSPDYNDTATADGQSRVK